MSHNISTDVVTSPVSASAGIPSGPALSHVEYVQLPV